MPSCSASARVSLVEGGHALHRIAGLQGTINVPHSSIFELQRICSNFFFFGFCFHLPGPNEYHFPPPKARPKSLLQKFFLRECEQGEGGAPTRAISGNAGRSASCFPPDTHCHAMPCAPKDWIDWITPRLSALRPACCNASSKTKQPTRVPNIGNRCRGRGQATNPIVIPFLPLTARTRE
jgi:hypothetical protein